MCSARINFQLPTSNAQRPTSKERGEDHSNIRESIPASWALGVGCRALGVGRLRRRHLHGSTATKPQTGVSTPPETPVFPHSRLPGHPRSSLLKYCAGRFLPLTSYSCSFSGVGSSGAGARVRNKRNGVFQQAVSLCERLGGIRHHRLAATLSILRKPSARNATARTLLSAPRHVSITRFRSHHHRQ